MCLAIPLKLTEIDGNNAVGERDVRRAIRVDFIHEPKVGDYVIAHVGFAIEKLRREQALENLAAIREVANAE